jgi:hypothetical protein
MELIGMFDTRVAERLEKRKQTEKYLNLIREKILILKIPHAPVKKIYNILKSEGKIDFSYQYFSKIVGENWNTLVTDDRISCIIVSSETNKLCQW